MSEKRPGDGVVEAPAPAPKRGRWDAPVPATNGAAAAAAAAPAAAVTAAPLTAAATSVVAAAAAAAQAAAVAARLSGAAGGVPAAAAGAGAAGAHLTPAAAAAVAAAAAAAMQRIPAGAPAGAGPQAAAGNGAAAGAAKPGLTKEALEKLEKAKKLLQLQKEIQEKAKAKMAQIASKLPAPSAPPPGAAAAAGGAAAVPALVPIVPGTASVRPLLGVPPAAAALAAAGALRAGSATPAPGLLKAGIASMLPPIAPTPAPAAAPVDDPFYDPALDRGRKTDKRRKVGFNFVQEGSFQREAELFRMKAHLGAAAFRKGAPRVSGPLGNPNLAPLGALPGRGVGADVMGMDANSVPLGKREPVASREGTPAPEAEPVPAVEWWDRGLLQHASLDADVPPLPEDLEDQVAAAAAAAVSYDDEENGGDDDEMSEADEGRRRLREAAAAAQRTAAVAAAAAMAGAAVGRVAAEAAAAEGVEGFALKEAKLTLYVEHPVPLDPPAEAPPPPPQPLKLTQKELKKLRTQRRLAREKEKQELVRQGLLEPPKPKVRIVNMHRVLGEEAALDPTAIEKEVRKQMAERQAAHEDRNLARKLTPAERREKKLKKLFGTAAVDTGVADVGAGRGGARGAAAEAAAAAGAAAGVDVICCVFRVGRLTDPLHKFKVDVNAKENHMTGISLISDDFSVVVVEGVEKAIRRYTKLMMRRIDWSTAPLHAPRGPGGAGGGPNGDVDMGEGEDEEDEDSRPPNVCTLVWQGTVLRRAFSNFRSETVRSGAAARQLLEDAGVAHYWDAAAAATEGQSVPYAI